MTKNTHQYEYAGLTAHRPLLAYDSSNPYDQWRRTVREKLTELLGLPLTACEPCLTVESEETLEDRTEIYFTVQTEPGYIVPCWLYIPVGVKSAPLTICLSGHGGGMHVAAGKIRREKDRTSLEEWPHRAMGLRAIREGRCALVVEARSFGEASMEGYGTSCTEASKIAILMGRTTIGERVWDVMRILDAVLAEFPEVEKDNIVCTGNSGGGTATYYLACMDERIAAAAPSCSVCTYEASIAAMPHCMCNHIPYIRKYFEMGDLACLIAPRKLVVAAGLKDDIFPIDGVRKTFGVIEQIYEAAGAAENCALVVGEGGHLNYADHIWEKLHEMGI
ncbi:MAG: hypothetical protein IJX14_10150 [Clostridia bacterium]|nr:hypothetical protein [Clostridia bacterium]